MPIAGVVITARPEDVRTAAAICGQVEGVEIYGVDDQGQIVAVLETRTTDEMEELMRRLDAEETVLQVGLTYLNVEDEAERMARGEEIPRIFGHRRGEKEQE